MDVSALGMKVGEPPAQPERQVERRVKEGSAEGAQNGQQQRPVDRIELASAIAEIESAHNVKIEMENHEGTGLNLITIKSSDGERVIRQIPEEGILDMVAKLRETGQESLLSSVV